MIFSKLLGIVTLEIFIGLESFLVQMYNTKNLWIINFDCTNLIFVLKYENFPCNTANFHRILDETACN